MRFHVLGRVAMIGGLIRVVFLFMAAVLTALLIALATGQWRW